MRFRDGGSHVSHIEVLLALPELVIAGFPSGTLIALVKKNKIKHESERIEFHHLSYVKQLINFYIINAIKSELKLMDFMLNKRHL